MPRSEQENHARNMARAKALDHRKQRIRDLNDKLRRTGWGGRTMATQGIRALSPEVLAEVMASIRAYDSFASHDDPYQEHDFGAVTVAGKRVLWKIDYYDPTLTAGSPDPANTEVTARVLTIMLAEEY